MRYALILFLACLPLAGLTAWSFVEALGPTVPAESVLPAPALAASRKLASDTATATAAEQPLLRALERTDLLAAKPRELSAGENARLKRLIDAWRTSQEARTLAARYAAAAPLPLDDDASLSARRVHTEDTLARLREFVADQRKASAGQLAGAEALFKLLDQRSKKLQGELAGYRRQDNMLASLQQASDDLDAGRYDECLAILASDSLNGMREGEAGARAQLLRKRAEYRQAGEALLARQPGGEADRQLYHAVESFLQRHPNPPAPTEAKLQAQLARKSDDLRLAVAIADLANPPDLETLLVQAAEIVAHEQVDDATRKRARARVVDWLLSKGFPRLEPPEDLLGKQEAVTKNEQRKIGIFFLPPGAEQWRYWTNRRDRERQPRGEEQIPRDSFRQPPAAPMYVTWAQGYNEQTARLIKQGGGRSDWQEFARRCDEWQKELTAYREKWGVTEEPDRSCRSWTFLDAAATARTVVDRWRQFEQILGKAT